MTSSEPGKKRDSLKPCFTSFLDSTLVDWSPKETVLLTFVSLWNMEQSLKFHNHDSPQKSKWNTKWREQHKGKRHSKEKNNRREKANGTLSAEQGSTYESERFTSQLEFQYIGMEVMEKIVKFILELRKCLINSSFHKKHLKRRNRFAISN